MIPKILFSTIILLSLLLISCATTSKMINLHLDMTKDEVIKVNGDPTVVRGSIKNKYDQIIEVWEYAEYKTSTDAFHGWETSYWFYFYDGKLVQWGEAGDWRKEADRIYEYRFK